MANSDKNIVITPNRNLGGVPEVSFTGFGNSSITLKIPDSTTATLNFESSGTNLLSIDSNLSSGSLFKVVDSDLVSIFDVTVDGEVTIRPQQTTSIGGNGLILPRYSTSSLPPGEEGLIVYDTTVKCVKLYRRSSWINLTEPNPNIITNGLVLYVDAANSSSYPKTGTTWKDLSGNGHDITLGPSVSFVNSFDGVLNFPENADGYGRNTSMNLSSSNYTVMSFVRKNINGNDGRTITAYNNNWLLGHHDTSYGDYYAEGWVNDVASPQSDTTWRMFTGTGNIIGDSYSLYINDQIIVTNSNGSVGPNGWNLNNQYGQYSDCQISNLICYNRVLTAAEVQQNFNALRGRFGI
jgi:hypothetical protein